MTSEEKNSDRVAELEARVAELENALSFISAAIDNMPNPIFMKDSDGRFVYFNRQYADNFGMDREKYIGGTVLDLEYLPEEDRRMYQAEDLRLIETGDVSSYDKNFLFTDGKTHPSLYWSKGFVCPDTGKRGLIGEIVDISGERNNTRTLTEIIRGASYMFSRFFVVDLENGVYSAINRNRDESGLIVSKPATEFFEKARGRFYNQLNRHLLDYCFNPDRLRELLQEHDDYYVECRDKQFEGAIFGITILCFERVDGVPTKVIYAFRDISDTKISEENYRNELKKDNQKLQKLANHDAMTGLYNRRGLMEIVSTRLTPDIRVAMLLMDVDSFKSVNDHHGHIAGDNLLKRVAQLLRDTFRSDDVLVRLGGDEFMVVLIDCDYEKGRFLPQKIQELNEALSHPTDDTPPASLSVGIAFSREGETQTLYDRADIALYHVKEGGRCGCCIYEDTFEKE